MLKIIIVLILFFDAVPCTCLAKFPCPCSKLCDLYAVGIEDSISVKSDSIINTRDTIRTEITNHPTISKVILQSLVGEVVFGGVFFGLDGSPILLRKDYSPYSFTDISLICSMATSAVAITVWGNAFSLGENNCWRPLLGEVGGLLLSRVFDDLDNFKFFSSSEIAAYSVVSTFVLAGAIATYYLWPTGPAPSYGSSSGFLIAPFISPQLSGVGVSYTIR